MKRRNFFKIFGTLGGVFALTQSKAVFNILMLKKKAVANGNVINITVASNTLKYDPFTAAGSPASVCTINLTINSGVYVWSDVYSSAAIDFGFSLPAGSTINIINNGYIMGKGGNGGSYNGSAVVPQPGGTAIIVRTTVSSITINSQTGYILGGGGGGGTASSVSGGGGAGGGDGGYTYNGSTIAGGAGGAVGVSGSTGAIVSTYTTGGGGGRVVPGTLTAGPNSTNANLPGAGGTGGGSGSIQAVKGVSTTGGSGGGAGVAGGNGIATGAACGASGGGGGYGAKGGDGYSANALYQVGGAAGGAVYTNGQAVTWVGGLGANQVYGSIT